ncbi:MAG: STAS domain-containing protein [Planctomycetota bacterium]|jgi:anti-sigma B factor antagonist|nr:STAS domain-containing protein [Planctomycetota bacterium]
MNWSAESIGGVMVFGFGQTFKIDFESSPEFAETLKKGLADGSQLLLDLNGVEYVDSRDLGILVYGVNQVLASGAEVKFFIPSETIREVFEVTHLNRVYDIFSDREKALNAFGIQSA